MRFLPEDRPATAAVVGMGYVGTAIAAVLTDRGVTVTGIDTDASLVEELESRYCRFSEAGLAELLFGALDDGRLSVTTDLGAAAEADVIVVTVGTPVRDDGRLMDTYLRDACAQLSERIKPGQLFVLKSTVPPGATRELMVPILETSGLVCGEDFGVAFCPERLSEGNALPELRSAPIIVGGYSEHCADAAAEFWSTAIGTEVLRCSSLETSEMVKLATNWWIDHNIAMANELAMLCGVLDVDSLEVIHAANSIPKGSGSVNILLPSVGVGGSCLTKDPYMVWRAARERDVDLRTIPVARDVNDQMPIYTVEMISEELAKAGKSVADATVAVLGLAFKNNTGDLRATPTLPVVTELRDGGAEVRIFDPLAEQDRLEDLFGQAPATSVEEATAGADCVAVLAGHDEFDDIDFAALRERVADSCAVIDGRAYYPQSTIERLEGLGFAYRGIGR